MAELTIPLLISLALVDSVNPCAIAVLSFMLIAFMTHNPKAKKKALLAGLGFIAAVYVLYFIYAVILVGVLNMGMDQFAGSELYVYGGFSLLAIALGVFNVKDFFWYRPGGLLREMPMRWRPKVTKLLESVETPKGAFLLGLFVTLFLLPCTIGPLVMACTLLSKYGVVGAAPWLLLYNLIFVVPMIVITLGIYGGLSAVQKAYKWKNENLKYLHLAAGLVMVAIGLYLAWEAQKAFELSIAGIELNFLAIGIIEVPLLFAIAWLRNRR